jgi:hypothetical protein
MNHCRLVFAACFILVISLASAEGQPSAGNQDGASQEKSLADVAKEAKQKKGARTKNTITDEDIANRSPLPRLSFEGVDNASEISDAIAAYREKHTKEQTEQVIHEWYDEYDSMLVNAIRNTTESKERRNSTLFTGFQLCQGSSDYQKCQLNYQAEMRGARHDEMVTHDDDVTIGRIQQAFMKVRSDLSRYNFHYEWFKIRSANGIGSY